MIVKLRVSTVILLVNVTLHVVKSTWLSVSEHLKMFVTNSRNRHPSRNHPLVVFSCQQSFFRRLFFRRADGMEDNRREGNDDVVILDDKEETEGAEGNVEAGPPLTPNVTAERSSILPKKTENTGFYCKQNKTG